MHIPQTVYPPPDIYGNNVTTYLLTTYPLQEGGQCLIRFSCLSCLNRTLKVFNSKRSIFGTGNKNISNRVNGKRVNHENADFELILEQKADLLKCGMLKIEGKLFMLC